jgi:transglutaminase-like putative cysteine protease
MKNPRHQLVLVGFLCQGWSWDNYVLPLCYALLWLLCLQVARHKLRVGPAAEGVALLVGCAGSWLLSHATGRSAHFFIGHGLALVQAVRLLRPLTRREKLTSLLIALFHLSAACTFVLDLRFPLVLAAALALIPKALLELEAESFPAPVAALGATPGAPSPPPHRYRLRLPAVFYLVVVAVMVVFFLVFPRAFLRTFMPGARTGLGEPTTMLETVLDPARSALAQSRQVLFHIEGERVGYLRCLSLTEFDGTQWKAPPRAALRFIPYAPWERLGLYVHRRVRVKNAAFLGRVLPVDGPVVFLVGRFFGRPMINAHGGIQTDSMWNTANNVYDYWIDPRAKPEALLRAQTLAYTRHPPVSPRLRAWLEERVAGVTNQYEQARRLESHLRDNFTYVLGAPELSRLNPTEDFLFNQKQGHCERFASALTLLLRLQGIPSRIVLGYVPTSRNLFSGGYNVRFKDAHAWTEGWFPDRGWEQFDATPRATTPPESWSPRDLMDDLDFAFSTYVVNFDAPTQSQILSVSVQTLAQAPAWLREHWQLLLVLTVALLFLFAWRRGRFTPAARTKPAVIRPKTVVLAEHYYGQMLRALARQGFSRPAHWTPYEFARELARQAAPFLAEVQRVTALFCAARYGNRPLTPSELTEIEQALQRLKKSGRGAA